MPAQSMLVIGDIEGAVCTAVTSAVPGVTCERAANLFDGIARLHGGSRYAAVLAAAEPMERRPEPAVRTLRKLCGDGRLILFGKPSMEPLNRKMLGLGCDDYFITPADPAELRQLFGAPVMRIAPTTPAADCLTKLAALPLAEITLDALLHHPTRAAAAALNAVNQQLSPDLLLNFENAPEAVDDQTVLEVPVRADESGGGTLYLRLPGTANMSAARHLLSQTAHALSRVSALDERHTRLQRLAITDDLTGLFNARYFRHFLEKIVDKARTKRFPVTLLLFDIDNFKHYNDSYGHGMGDEILRQTATLMKRCVREHDLVARIAGDEFAVVFWEKEGPRKAFKNNDTSNARIPQTPVQIAERFRRLINSEDFTALGNTGQGQLTISGGMSVFPYDAASPDELIDAADRALMFGAKKSGKNSIFLVGEDESAERSGHF